ncbi:MAG TPA: 4-hydroxy-3-methylbut-2-enyl diphosphate reductase [Acidimicrobiales bacterium]|nr:4-hydroxy-3-methylbut-2-enyl diphosphate reductase [Acidimicrobiales bacterium]
MHDGTHLETGDPSVVKRASAVERASVVDKVLLADPRGFCAGVEMAIKALAWMVRIFEPPVYCYHEIVHNRLVVEEFSRQGVVFVDDVDEVPPGSALMLSAHGSAPEVEEAAATGQRVVVDAVCPLVTKVHHELKVRANKGYTVVYVGHAGHEEAIGTMAVAPDAVRLVQSEADVAGLGEPGTPVALLAQTTLPHDEWAGIAEATRRRFPELWMPGRSDLCYATTNRQDALRRIAGRCDAVVVIGSANSSNTVSLTHVAASAGCNRVLRVNSAAELPADLAGVVGVTAGASAPEWLVSEVLEALDPLDGIETARTVEEDEYFPPPRDLRDLLRAVSAAACVTLGIAEPGAPPGTSDREVAAADMLAAGRDLPGAA